MVLSLITLYPPTGARTAIDLAIQTLAWRYTAWSVDPDCRGSDHFPIVIKYDKPSGKRLPQRWRLSQADWNNYSLLCSAKLTSGSFLDKEDPIRSFSTALVEIANNCISKTSQCPRKLSRPWFTPTCKKEIAV